MGKIKVFIVDDSPVARHMLIRMLSTESDIEIVGEVGTGQGCIIMLDEVNPDVVILEVAISGGMSINDVITELKALNPDIKIILCADSRSSSKLVTATETGVYDFIMKPYVKTTVLRIIRETAGV